MFRGFLLLLALLIFPGVAIAHPPVTLTDTQHQGSNSAASTYTLDADLSGPFGRIVRYTITAYSTSPPALLFSQSEGWTPVSYSFGPQTCNLQGCTKRATSIIYQAVDPPASLPLVVNSSVAATFASNLTVIDPAE